METPPDTLEEEIKHDATLRTEAIVGGLALLIVILGGVIWYMATHPPRAGLPSTQNATSTPVATGSENQLITENAAYYEIKAVHPASTPLAHTAGVEADRTVVALMRQFELDTIATFKRDGNFANLSHDDIQIMGLDQRKMSLDITYDLKSSPKTTSYIYTIYQDTLGAHPNAFFRTFTFNTATGKLLAVSDIFTPGTNYLSVLSAESRKRLPTMIAARVGVSVSELDPDSMNDGTAPEADNFQNWYLDGRNLVLIFPPYQVAPYAAGVLSVSIPLSQLSSVSPAYK